uniref:Uncharacterized protein n=1 Tax=Cyanothece sp. (strain PCC 7425 / ATCC 29141) TaxID=395961 RepID=B8HNB9_CYAP4
MGSDLYARLPSSEELLSSDETPMDSNKAQNFLPKSLLFLLKPL